jgi:hypothetical protein
MRFFTLISKKRIGQDISKKTEKISEVTVFKNQYILNKKYRPLAVLREKVNNSLLPVYQIWKILKIGFWVIPFSVTPSKKNIVVLYVYNIF